MPDVQKQLKDMLKLRGEIMQNADVKFTKEDFETSDVSTSKSIKGQLKRREELIKKCVVITDCKNRPIAFGQQADKDTVIYHLRINKQFIFKDRKKALSAMNLLLSNSQAVPSLV